MNLTPKSIITTWLILIFFYPVSDIITISSQPIELVPTSSLWKYFKGSVQPSNPSWAWIEIEFDDSSWPVGKAPFYYGEAIENGTLLNDMRGNYTTVFLRQKFYVEQIPPDSQLVCKYLVDDGIAVWINEIELFRYNVPSGELTYQSTAPTNAPEPAIWQTNFFPASFLKLGTNQICVVLVNRSLTSSDILFDLELQLQPIDKDPPKVVRVEPEPGITVSKLEYIIVEFNEAVDGIDEEDLLINGTCAHELTLLGNNRYKFSFPQPQYGVVTVEWAHGHGIKDFALIPNTFVPEKPFDKWNYNLIDANPPRIIKIIPPPGVILPKISRIQIWFDEVVTGVNTNSLLVNGTPSGAVEGFLDGPYIFEFDPPVSGQVNFSWAEDNTITDIYGNRVEPASWTVIVDPAWTPPNVRINEILCSNSSGLTDEDGDYSDWIEIWNLDTRAVSLLGWSLSDDPERPDKWIFPDVVLQPGEFLIVFASGKNRTDPNKPLHTNFKLGLDGEILVLYDAEEPRRKISGFPEGYPQMRTDVAYGVDETGKWVYYAIPTPGKPNSGVKLTGITVEPQFSVKHGLFLNSFNLELTCEDPFARIWYTTDGSIPAEGRAFLYTGPIKVDKTLAIRAVATSPGKLPSKVITQTYIFPQQVIYQPKNPEGFPSTWGQQVVIPADYEMDRRVVDDPKYQAELLYALTMLPSISLVMSIEDWFSPTRGIYRDYSSSVVGDQWEREVSVEFIPPVNSTEEGFQTHAGIRVQGGTSPIRWKMQKLSFKLRFRADYGPRWLEYPLFPDSPIRRFDTLILDAHMNNTWAYGGGVEPEKQRQRATYIHEKFVNELQLATGRIGIHSRWIHLYINGLYWGLYELHEEASEGFAAQYFGGRKDEYDVLKHSGSNIINGDGCAWNELMNLVRSDILNPKIYDRITSLLDIDAFIDYMLVHFYVGNTDWPHQNWYALRYRSPNGKWYFVNWDSEHVMESLTVDCTGVNHTNSPGEIYDRLRLNPEFCLRFADRINKHFSSGGILYVDPNQPQWNPQAPDKNVPAAKFYKLMDEIYLPIVCESARWGDNQRPSQPYTRDIEWINATGWLLNTFFPQRTGLVLNQLKTKGLIPSVPSPIVSQKGGLVSWKSEIRLYSDKGTIYYTLDGSDPREPYTGLPSATAKVYSGSPIKIESNIWLKARTYLNSQWSALTEEIYIIDNSLTLPLYPTEIMYNPPGGDPYEFIELRWFGSLPLDVSGYYFEGITYQFPQGSLLQPGQLIVLASSADRNAFSNRYPQLKPFGYFEGRLANEGEHIRLKNSNGQVIWHVRYRPDRGWPSSPNGQGYSLELRSLDFSLSDPAAWQASEEVGGSPGQWNYLQQMPTLTISEVHPTGRPYDWIELVNTSNQAIELSGWILMDESDRSYPIPSGVVLAPNQRIIIWCTGQTNEAPFQAPFALSASGDTVVLKDPTGKIVDAVSFGFVPAGYSIGRIEDGKWGLCIPTRGEANESARISDQLNLRINEILANPVAGEDDWIEIYNLSDNPVPLKDLYVKIQEHVVQIRYMGWVPSKGFITLICDERSDRGHLESRLPAAGATVALIDRTGQIIDMVEYPSQVEGYSYGRSIDGVGEFIAFSVPSPNGSNILGGDLRLEITRRGEELILRFPARADGRYMIQFNRTISSPIWEDWQLIDVPSNNELVEILVPIELLGPQGFFRIKKIEPSK